MSLDPDNPPAMPEARFEILRQVTDADQFGRWYPSALDLGRALFGESDDVIRKHMTGDIVVLALSADHVLGQCVASMKCVADFEGLRRSLLGGLAEGVRGAYFSSAAVRSENQGAGLFTRLNALRLRAVFDEGAQFIMITTQNPAVERGVRHALDRLVAQGLLAGYGLDRVLSPRHYGRLLTDHQPATDGSAFEALDRRAGDAFILCFRLDRAPLAAV